MANPRKFSEKIALHNQKQAEETAAFEKIMREVSDATNKVSSGSRRARAKASPAPASTEASLRPQQQGLGEFRGGSLPNVAAPQVPIAEPENKPEETTLATQYVMSGARSGGTSPSRSPGQRGRASSSVGPMRTRPAERKHDTSPYGSTIYLSPPQTDSSWRRSNSDSALHQSFNEAPVSASLSPHHPLHSHAHPHHAPHHHRRATTDIHLDAMTNLVDTQNPRPRSSCEMPRVPNNTNAYDAGGGGGGGGGGLSCGELQVPGGSLPDLTSVHFPPPHAQQHRPHSNHPQHPRAPSPSYAHQSPSSPGAISPGAGSISPATGGLSPASGSPVGATVPVLGPMDALHAALRQDNSMYDVQNHLSVPNTNNYLHHSKNQNNMSPIDHAWITSSYQSHCSPPSQYSSTSNINIPSPTMVHSPGSPVESPQTSDYSNLHQALLQPFEQITMDWAQLVQSLVDSGWTAHVQVNENLDGPPSNYSTGYINHGSPVSPQPTGSPHTYTTDCDYQSQVHRSSPGMNNGRLDHLETRSERDPVPGGNPFPRLTPPAPPTPASIPDIILTDYSGELDAGIFGGEEAQLRAGLDLDELTLLEEPSSLLPDSSVEHEFRLDRL